MTRNQHDRSETGQVGTWLLDLHSGVAWRDDAHDQAFGYEAMAGEWNLDRFMSHVASSDHGIVYDRYLAAVELYRPWSFSCDVTGADGQARRVKASGDFLPGDGRAPPRLAGFVMNVPTIDSLEAALNAQMDRIRRADATLHTSLGMMERAARREEGETREAMLRHLCGIASRAADDGERRG